MKKKGGGGGGGKYNSGGGSSKGRIGVKRADNMNTKKKPTSSTQSSNWKQQNKVSKKIAIENKNNEKQMQHPIASVGLTGEAHNVMKEALRASNSASNLLLWGTGDDNIGINTINTNNNSPIENIEKNNTKKTTSSFNKRTYNNRRSCPDLQPPPKITNDDSMGPMGDQRRGLPVYSYKKQLLKTIANNRVTVVEGETGK